jgi:RimJ/RimL family protein N-acetyltransferase
MPQRNRLTGEHIKLTAIREADIATIIAWDDDPEFMRMQRSDPAYPRPEVAQRAWWAERLKKPNEYSFAIRRLEDDGLIGTFHISEIEWPHLTAWFSIGIGEPDARGQGYGGEALALGLNFAFNDVNLHRITLSVFAYNEPAIRLYERLGFIREGTLREFLRRDGQRFDMHIYSLLAREWQSRD